MAQHDTRNTKQQNKAKQAAIPDFDALLQDAETPETTSTEQGAEPL